MVGRRTFSKQSQKEDKCTKLETPEFIECSDENLFGINVEDLEFEHL